MVTIKRWIDKLLLLLRLHKYHEAQPDKQVDFTVLIDDNYHYMDKDRRYTYGEFATCQEAVDACKAIVDAFLEDAYKPDMTAGELYKSYIGFGEDPFIQTEDRNCTFSAWTYAKTRCQEIVEGRS